MIFSDCSAKENQTMGVVGSTGASVIEFPEEYMRECISSHDTTTFVGGNLKITDFAGSNSFNISGEKYYYYVL